MSILTSEERNKLIAMPAAEFDAMMCKTFPEIFADRNAPMTETCMCWGFSCGPGWYPLLFDLCQKIDYVSRRLGIIVKASQVKEKFATLRFYWNGILRPKPQSEDLPTNMSMDDDIIDTLVSHAENESARTCDVCGEYGKTYRICGWMRTLCAKHAAEEAAQKGTTFTEEPDSDLP